MPQPDVALCPRSRQLMQEVDAITVIAEHLFAQDKSAEAIEFIAAAALRLKAIRALERMNEALAKLRER